MIFIQPNGIEIKKNYTILNITSIKIILFIKMSLSREFCGVARISFLLGQKL